MYVCVFCCFAVACVVFVFVACVLCACDLLIVKIWHLRAGYPASNLQRFLKQGATRIAIRVIILLLLLLLLYCIVDNCVNVNENCEL